MSQRCLLASLQAPFLKEKKGVRFSARYLQQKRNLLVLDHSHQQRWIIASQDETTGPSVHPEDATSTKMVHETLSHANAESGGNSEKVGSNSEQSHVALAGPNPEHMHDVFLATNWRHHIEPVPTATVVNASIDSTNTSVSTTITQDAPSTSHSLSSLQVHSPVFPQAVAAGPTIEDTSITQADLHPSPEWTIPPNDFPEPEHNWANAYATSYKVPEENKLQRKTYDIGSFIKWFCRRTGKKKLCKADLEGPTFNLVKAFHKNSVFLQYQMDECHKLLTNKVDLSNPEGHQILRNIYEPLPLGGPPGQVTIQPQFFFNRDLDYLLTGDKEAENALLHIQAQSPSLPRFGLEIGSS
ncbi:hypothetical protein Tco_0027307 [Tanacetum coccineum]